MIQRDSYMQRLDLVRDKQIIKVAVCKIKLEK